MKASRHARNNMRLYRIQEADLQAAISAPDNVAAEAGRVVALKSFPGRFSGFPLKVIYTEEGGDILIVTAYPLKRGRKG